MGAGKIPEARGDMLGDSMQFSCPTQRATSEPLCQVSCAGTIPTQLRNPGQQTLHPGQICTPMPSRVSGHGLDVLGGFVVSNTLSTLPALGQQPHVGEAWNRLHSSPGPLATLVGLEN